MVVTGDYREREQPNLLRTPFWCRIDIATETIS